MKNAYSSYKINFTYLIIEIQIVKPPGFMKKLHPVQRKLIYLN